MYPEFEGGQYKLEHLANGLALANKVIKANPKDYLGYRVAADSYRLRRDWKGFDRTWC